MNGAAEAALSNKAAKQEDDEEDETLTISTPNFPQDRKLVKNTSTILEGDEEDADDDDEEEKQEDSEPAFLGDVEGDFSIQVHDDTTVSSSARTTTQPVEEASDAMVRKKKKRGRLHIAKILPIYPNLPNNQYECQLIRRENDTALGMKLNIIETGDVVVQHVTSLADGTASPAILTGKIRRGDVLISIDGKFLAGGNALSVLNCLKDTKVLSYHLRLAAGEGLRYLRKNDVPEKETKIPQHDPAGEMLGLFPMVDQLSGMPLFDEHVLAPTPQKSNKTKAPLPIQETPKKSASEGSLAMNEHISSTLAETRKVDRDFYLLEWLRENPAYNFTIETEIADTPMTLAERQVLGGQAMCGAKNLLARVTVLDNGKDNRSFHNWNTTLSLYSRASTRRKRIFDAASLPLSSFGRLEEAKDEASDNDGQSGTDVGIAGSTTSSQQSGQQLDGDELLLCLAARDEIWRNQVIEFLNNVVKEASNDDEMQNAHTNEPALQADMNTALSNELGSFLFGENMTKILAKHKTPRALPPEEVTAVLFDLATRLSATVPDEIKAAGSLISPRTGLTPFEEKQKEDKSDLLLATRFLLDRALPAWLKTFRPLAWEHRRMLWPVDRIQATGASSSMASSLSDDDITLDSTGSQLTSTMRKRKKKELREIVEEHELNIETRGETCFLTTYYFIHGLLPKAMGRKVEVGSTSESVEKDSAKDDIVVFLGEYGSYLKMDTCLAYASALRFDAVVDLLLSIAKYDPRHKEVIKQTAKSVSMVFYEPTMLSAVLQLLRSVVDEKTKDRKLSILELCAAAYPDVQPWQVKKTSDAADNGEHGSLYYQYLSLLLHPIDGNELARRDSDLVKEWCCLSIEKVRGSEGRTNQDYLSNFLSVASKASSDHLVYHRDIPFLLEQAMSIDESNLVLDLSGEVIDDDLLSKEQGCLETVATKLRSVSVGCLDDDDGFLHAQRRLRRILRLFNKKPYRDAHPVHEELVRWIQHKQQSLSKPLADPVSVHPDILELIHFLAEEAEPLDILQALSKWCPSEGFHPDFIPVLHSILPKGASAGSELSTALFHIKIARQRLAGNLLSSPPSDTHLSEFSERSAPASIWKAMASGILTLDK